MEKIEGYLTYNAASCSFWIFKDGSNLEELKFGDVFEVKTEDENWVETCLEITSGDDGELVFRLRGTNYYGKIDGLEVRK